MTTVAPTPIPAAAPLLSFEDPELETADVVDDDAALIVEVVVAVELVVCEAVLLVVAIALNPFTWIASIVVAADSVTVVIFHSLDGAPPLAVR